jgi:outer membrane protein assembly factor BamA
LYLTGNLAFYLGHNNETNLSSILISPLITQKQQFVAPVQLSIWTKNNKYNIVTDWRFLKYPENTYGLGGLTTESDAVQLDYDQVRLYTFLLRKITKNFYGGLGYQFDNHWNIAQLNVSANTVTDFDKYGYSKSSISSGPSVDLLFDTRTNSLSPEAGSNYANIVFRQNLHALGSDANWSSLLIDLRKYFRLSDRSDNILAFWSYNWLTVNGTPPYMDLPSTGWDAYSNTGRGYIQSRFRSKNMIDLESEYRFVIMHNGLLGGVVFANAQSYSEISDNQFKTILPGWGAGLRIRFNKFSKTNICIDYGFGLHGSNGLFVNLGEVF